MVHNPDTSRALFYRHNQFVFGEGKTHVRYGVRDHQSWVIQCCHLERLALRISHLGIEMNAPTLKKPLRSDR